MLLYNLMSLTNLRQIDQGISPEVVRSVLAERGNRPFLATTSAYRVSDVIILIVCGREVGISCFVRYWSAIYHIKY